MLIFVCALETSFYYPASVPLLFHSQPAHIVQLHITYVRWADYITAAKIATVGAAVQATASAVRFVCFFATVVAQMEESIKHREMISRYHYRCIYEENISS